MNDHPSKGLRTLYIALLALTVSTVVLFEVTAMRQHQADTGPLAVYWMEIAGVLLTVVLIPIGMKMSGQHRMLLIYLPLLYNTIVYYLFSPGATCGYLALISLVAMAFAWPCEPNDKTPPLP